MKKTIFFLVSVIVLAACSAKVTMMSESDASRAAKKFSGTTLANLNEGKTNYEANCGLCHGLKKPDARTEEQWREIVPRMVNQVNKKLGKEEIDAQEQQNILAYLVTMGATN